MPRVLVAIPALNERRTIASLVMLSSEYADSVLVVDDGSKDQTVILAKLAGAQVISHDVNLGKGVAILSAFKWAMRNRFDIIVFLDGDGQHDPGAIPVLIRPILTQEADITIGSRWHHEEGLEEMPLHRIVGNWVLSTATSLSLNRMIKDSQSGFRAYHMKTVPALMQAMETGFSIESELIALADKAGLRWKEVGIRASYIDLDTSTDSSWHHGLSVLYRSLRLLRIHRPVRFFGSMSFFCYFGALSTAVWHSFIAPAGELAAIRLYIMAACAVLGSFFMFCGIMFLGLNRVSERITKLVLHLIRDRM